MSLYDYHYSQKLALEDPPLDALIMAAIRKADSTNMARLEAGFPELVTEMRARYNAPLGVIPEDGEVDMDAVAEGRNRLLGIGD